MKKIAIALTAALFGVFAISACAGGGQSSPGKQPMFNPNQTSAPTWVYGGGGPSTVGGGKVFSAVGAAPKMRDISMQRDRACNRARAGILKIFNSYIAYMMKDYSRSTTAGDMSKESYEADVLAVQKTISIGDISGAQIVDTWRDPADSTIYSLAVLDLAAVSDILANKDALDSKLRDYVRANAAKAFDDLEKEEAKHAK